MSPTKRLCISLLHAPSRSSNPQQCSLQFISITARGDSHHYKSKPHHQTRSFTVTHRKNAGNMSAARQMKMRTPSQPSIAVTKKAQEKAATRDGAGLEQYGLLPGTIVPPTGDKQTSWLKDPRGRWAFEYHRWSRSFMQWFTGIYFSKWKTQPRFSLEKGKTPAIAKELYENMYRHFASGDLAPIEHRLSPGLAGSLRARISQRAPNTSMLWTLEIYLSQPKLVWFSTSMLDPKRPPEDQIGLLQAVVQIRSRQRLQKVQRKVVGKDRQVREVLVNGEGKEIHEDDMEKERRRSTKDTMEYVVLHRIVKKSRPGPWLIWGTTEETSLAKVQKSEEQLRNIMASRQKK